MATLVARISEVVKAIALEIKNIKLKLPIYSITEINNTNYSVLPIDRVVLLTNILSSKSFTLPDILTYPLGTFLAIGDSSGLLSESVYLDIVSQSSDTISPLGSPIRLTEPNMVLILVRGPGRKWIVVQ